MKEKSIMIKENGFGTVPRVAAGFVVTTELVVSEGEA